MFFKFAFSCLSPKLSFIVCFFFFLLHCCLFLSHSWNLMSSVLESWSEISFILWFLMSLFQCKRFTFSGIIFCFLFYCSPLVPLLALWMAHRVHNCFLSELHFCPTCIIYGHVYIFNLRFMCLGRHELMLGNTFLSANGSKPPNKEIPPQVIWNHIYLLQKLHLCSIWTGNLLQLL